jgi:hypothetical protein
MAMAQASAEVLVQASARVLAQASVASSGVAVSVAVLALALVLGLVSVLAAECRWLSRSSRSSCPLIPVHLRLAQGCR